MIRLVAVSHAYPNGTKALDNVTLEVAHNHFTALIGASGAGKSTLLRILNGLVKPEQGSVWSGDIDLSQASPNQVRRVQRSTGMVFQQFNLIRRRSALENVLAGRLGALPSWRSSLRLYPKADRELSMHLLERVGLADYAWQRADTLSGGQQQRVGIARALAQKPKVILADEPISALDPKSAEQVMQLLYSIHHEDGIAVIASLHILDTVRAYADRVIGLRQGQVLFDGTPAELSDDVAAALFTAKEPQPRPIGEQDQVTKSPAHARSILEPRP